MILNLEKYSGQNCFFFKHSTVCFAAVSAGTALAWTAPVLPQLAEISNSTDQRFTVSKSEGKFLDNKSFFIWQHR